MIKVKNEKIELSIYKNNKLIKNVNFKNSLTDQYLDMIIYYMLPQTIGDVLFPNIVKDGNTTSPFYYGAFDFTLPKQTINTSSTTANYTEKIFRQDSNVKYLNNGKEIISTYSIQSFSNDALLNYVLFFSQKNTNYRLSSFIDVSSLEIYGTDNIQMTIKRYDKITSNEIPIEELSLSYDFLPRIETNLFVIKYITKICLYYGENASGYFDEYSIYDLSFSKISAGVVEVTGFNNFYIGTYDYPQEDYPQNDYPQEQGKVKSVKFTYSNGTETYVNIEDLDITYNNTELKIRLKCERGAY